MHSLEQFFLTHPWWQTFDGRPVFMGVLAALSFWMGLKYRFNEDVEYPVPRWVNWCGRGWLLLSSLVMAIWAYEMWQTGSMNGASGGWLWILLVSSVVCLGCFVAAIVGMVGAALRHLR